MGKEGPNDLGILLQLFQVFPIADGKTRQVRGADCRGLHRLALQHGDIQQVGLELHDELVARGTAIDRQALDRKPHVLLHGAQHVITLVGHGLAGRTHNGRTARGAGQTAHDTAGMRVPPGSAQTRKGGDEVAALVVVNRSGELCRLAHARDDAHVIAKPVHGGTGSKDGALECIADLAVRGDTDRGDQTVLGFDDLVAGVHEHKATRAIGVFGLAGMEAAVAEQRRLLVARHAHDGWHVGHDIARDAAVVARAPTNLGHHGTWNVKERQ